MVNPVLDLSACRLPTHPSNSRVHTHDARSSDGSVACLTAAASMPGASRSRAPKLSLPVTRHVIAGQIPVLRPPNAFASRHRYRAISCRTRRHDRAMQRTYLPARANRSPLSSSQSTAPLSKRGSQRSQPFPASASPHTSSRCCSSRARAGVTGLRRGKGGRRRRVKNANSKTVECERRQGGMEEMGGQAASIQFHSQRAAARSRTPV